ncbi:MAG: hypothetical protein IPF83_08660 [Rhodanobacteraceae bacterium]|jgi:hypothetical protein|nr:hypothetical protein [Rhodanobacteraceae bacterium]MBP9155826.1 hypothetical protein [Xanthomonadales bacterium]
MKHVLVQWIPTIEAESIFVALELDDRGLEARRVEVFPDGRIGYADGNHSVDGAELSVIPTPHARNINAQTPFVAKDISLEDFERYWDRALTQASSSTGD